VPFQGFELSTLIDSIMDDDCAALAILSILANPFTKHNYDYYYVRPIQGRFRGKLQMEEFAFHFK